VSNKPGDGKMELKEILLVDDKSPILGNIGRILQNWGYLVVLAPDAMTALENVQIFQFDLIVVSLGGNEGDKLNLLRWARRSSPPAKLIVVGNPSTTLPVEVFQVEVDDYLLPPFSAMELSERVDRCLHGDKVNPKEKVDLINGKVLNSLRLKIRNIHNGLLAMKARVNHLIGQEYSLSAEDRIANVHEISHDIGMLTRVTENMLCNMLVCCIENEISSIEKDHTADYVNKIKCNQGEPHGIYQHPFLGWSIS
jgi:DNA-binding response OmpR family regulator